jgi:hypothetical protein
VGHTTATAISRRRRCTTYGHETSAPSGISLVREARTRARCSVVLKQSAPCLAWFLAANERSRGEPAGPGQDVAEAVLDPGGVRSASPSCAYVRAWPGLCRAVRGL